MLLCGTLILIHSLLRIYIPSSASNSYFDPQGYSFTNSIVYDPLFIISLAVQSLSFICFESLTFNV